MGESMVELDEMALESVALDGMEVPLVDLNFLNVPPRQLGLNGTTYTYVRSYPLKGYAAVAPTEISELLTAGRHVLMAERGGRFYLYQA
jgi:hypothetical protein